MAQSTREVMTADPRTVELSATVRDAAWEMHDGDVGRSWSSIAARWSAS